jgi:hypothetical protein
VVGVKSDCVWSGGSSLSRTERSVARRVRGLGAMTSEVDTADRFGEDEEGRSRRKGSGLVCVTGELSTASRTGSKAGILDAAERKQNQRRLEEKKRRVKPDRASQES